MGTWSLRQHTQVALTIILKGYWQLEDSLQLECTNGVTRTDVSFEALLVKQ